MSEERYKNIASVFDVVDSALGCVFGLLTLVGAAFLLLVVVSFLLSLVS
jgi:hypothetical protein